MSISISDKTEIPVLPPATVRPRPRVQKDITVALVQAIATDRFPPGANLPRENDLCAEFGVSRTVIREVLKVLESKGLVRGRPRVGTVVRDREDWSILDGELLDWLGPEFFDLDLLSSVLEARSAFEPAAAELAATRASSQEVADLEQAWTRMNVAEDGDAFSTADVAFHTILLKASHNRIFSQLSGPLQGALSRAVEVTNHPIRAREKALQLHWSVVEAVRMRDTVGARTAMNAILALAAEDLAAVIAAHDASNDG